MSVTTDLQTAVNRFSAAAGFPPVPVDDQLSPMLGATLIAALNRIPEAAAPGLIAKLQNSDGSANLAQIAASAPGLTIYLNQQADALNLPAGAMTIFGFTMSPTIAYAGGAMLLLLVGYGAYHWSQKRA